MADKTPERDSPAPDVPFTVTTESGRLIQEITGGKGSRDYFSSNITGDSQRSSRLNIYDVDGGSIGPLF